MRIALFSPEPPDPAGCERARIAAAEARELAARGHAVAIATPTPGRGGPALEALAPFDVAHVLGWARLGDDIVRRLAVHGPVVLSLLDDDVLCARGRRPSPVAEIACPAVGDLAPCLGCLTLAPDPAYPLAGLSTETADAHRRARAAEVRAAARVVFPSLAHLVRVREHVPLERARVRIVPPGHGLQLGALAVAAADAAPTLQRAIGAWRARPPAPRPYRGRGPLRVLHLGPWSVEQGSLDLANAVAGLAPGVVEIVALSDACSYEGVLALGCGKIRVERRGDDRALAALASECHLAALPSRRQESYALGLDEVTELGLPAWVTCAAVAAERFDRGTFGVLPARDPGAWTEAFEALLRAPRRAVEAFAAAPRSVPTAAAAAASLETIFHEAVAEARQAAGRAA